MNTKLFVLLFGDMFLSIIALYTGSLLRFGSFSYIESILGVKVLIVTTILILSSFLMELYSYDNNIGKKEAAVKIAAGVALSFIILSALYYIFSDLMFSRGLLLLSLATFGFYQLLWHLSYKYCIHLPTFAQRILIVGTGPLAKNIGKIITTTNHSYCLAGYVDCPTDSLTYSSDGHNGNGNGNGTATK